MLIASRFFARCCVDSRQLARSSPLQLVLLSHVPSVVGCRVAAKLRAAQGLSALSACQYETAARELLQVPLRLGDAFASVVHVEEVALYASLTAMATFSREELRASVMTSPAGRQLLELVPPVRDALVAFVNSKYASCLEALHSLQVRRDRAEAIRLRAPAVTPHPISLSLPFPLLVTLPPTLFLFRSRSRPLPLSRPVAVSELQVDYLALDMFLAPHVDSLLYAIRKRALQQYLTPYTSVDLRTMAAAFHIAVGPLESEIASLIGEGGLKARLDSDRKLLHAHVADERRAALEGAVAASAAFAAQARVLLLRASMESEGMFVGAAGHSDRTDGGVTSATASATSTGAEAAVAALDAAVEAADNDALRTAAFGEAPAGAEAVDAAADGSQSSMLAEAALAPL